MTDPFWAAVDEMLDSIRSEKPATFDGVAGILNAATYPRTQHQRDRAFFPGGGGDRLMLDALVEAGWRITWAEAYYYYAARHPITGETLTYVEGDVYRGDQRA